MHDLDIINYLKDDDSYETIDLGEISGEYNDILNNIKDNILDNKLKISFINNGENTIYFENKKIHRENGPAKIQKYEDKYRFEYWANDIHNWKYVIFTNNVDYHYPNIDIGLEYCINEYKLVVIFENDIYYKYYGVKLYDSDGVIFTTVNTCDINGEILYQYNNHRTRHITVSDIINCSDSEIYKLSIGKTLINWEKWVNNNKKWSRNIFEQDNDIYSWIEENAKEQLNPFTKELFLDRITEFRFLEEFKP